MGQTWSSFYSYWFPNKEYKLVLVGLDNAGKTTTLYRLHLGQAVVTHPTVGSNVEQISFRNLEFEVRALFNATAVAVAAQKAIHTYTSLGLHWACFEGLGSRGTSKLATILADIL